MSQPAANDPAARLRELARLLRQTYHLGPEAQQSLANLVEELSGVLDVPSAPAQAHLADSTAHLVEAIHHQKDTGLLNAAKRRLETAAVRAETEAPVATGIVRRLIEALANLGI
jgi:hypothetical protein